MQQFGISLRGDKTIWVIWFVLAIFSILAIYSATAALAYYQHAGDTDKFLYKQIWIIFTGFLLAYAISRIPYRFFWAWAEVFFVFSLLALILTFFFGLSINQAKRWLMIPFLGVSFQASDLAKIGTLLLLSKNLTKYQSEKTDGFFSRFILLPLGIVTLLVLPSNFSTAFLLFFNNILLSWIAGARWRTILQTGAILGVIGAISIVFVVYVAPTSFKRAATWKSRIEHFWQPNNEENYQIQEAKTAIWHGGFLGQGLGKGHMRYTLPHPYSDMIFAFIIEEYGSLLGGLLVIFLYVVLLFRSIQIAQNAQTYFAKIIAIGIGLSLSVQAMVNMAVAVGLFPVTGQPLPLLSMGGTSSWFTCILIGILLSVSQDIQKKNNKKTINT